jgi:sugar/nucleoside kinase (ribokinase family)
MCSFGVQVIVNFGSIALDTTRTPFKTVVDVLGGSGTFFGLAASFFHKTGLIGVVGEDFPDKYMKLLEERLDLTGLAVEKGKTFRFDSSFGYDLGTRTTNKTELNVFGEWEPSVPDEYKDAPYLYLGNIGPEQQLLVLDQMNEPELTVADSIELWIKTRRDRLIDVISRVNGMVLNDDEVRQLCRTSNLITGARTIMDLGADFVIVKKGEHGAILFTPEMIFPTCGYPLEEIVDPTGAGDAFAGGFIGHLARRGKIDDKTMKEAVIYGNVVGSFAVEEFSIDRFIGLTMEDIEGRYLKYKQMVAF